MFALGVLEGLDEIDAVPVKIQLFPLTIQSSLVATLQLLPDGTLQTIANGNTISYDNQWATGKFSVLGASYEAKLTLDSGNALTSGSAVDSWLPLSDIISWSLYSPLGVTISSECTLEIRPKGGSTVATASIVFIAGEVTPVISITNHTIVGEDLAGITLTTTGSLILLNDEDSIPIPTEWSSDEIANLGDYYEVRLVKLSGADITSGTLNTWLPLSSDVSWEYEDSDTYIESFVGNLSIRQNGSSLILDTAQITLTAGTVIALPVASEVEILGLLEEGETVNGNYSYSHPLSIPQGVSTYQWYRADDDTGTNKEAINGATSISYTITSSEVNKHIQFEVTPVDQEANIGSPVSSNFEGPIEASPISIPTTALAVCNFDSPPDYLFLFDGGNTEEFVPVEAPAPLAEGILSMAWRPDGTKLVLGGSRRLGIYKTENNEFTTDNVPSEFSDLLSSTAGVIALAWSHNSRYLAIGITGGSEDKLHVYDYNTGSPIKMTLPDLPTGNIRQQGLVWSLDNRYLIGCATNEIFGYDFNSTPSKLSFPGGAPTSNVFRIFVTPDSEYIICHDASSDYVYNINNGVVTAVVSGDLVDFVATGNQSSVYSWSPDTEILIRSGIFYSWNDGNPTQMFELWVGGTVTNAAIKWSSDGLFFTHAIGTTFDIYSWDGENIEPVDYTGTDLGQISDVEWRPVI